MKTQGVLAVLVVLAVASAQEEGQVYCGRRLASTLAMLCENGLIKRSEARPGEHYQQYPQHSQYPQHPQYPQYTPHVQYAQYPQFEPWVPPHRAHSLARGKRQVVNECCEKPCTISELLSYCA